jgi:hypothetical protein
LGSRKKINKSLATNFIPCLILLMALYEQTKSINAIKLHKNFSNFSLHLIKSIALSSLLQKLAGIITEVIKFYQAHIFPNWIQHLLYGEEWFLSQSFSTTTTSTAVATEQRE